MAIPVLISIEGLDGTGKSVQFKLLVDWLKQNGYIVTSCVEPGGTTLGQKVRELLLHGPVEAMSAEAEMFLFMASRAELFNQVIIPAFNRGEIVVTDRSVLSTVVYQGHAGNVAINKVVAAGKIATRGISPNLTLVLDAPESVTSARRSAKADRIERKGEAFNRTCRTGFLIEAKNNSHSIKVVDAVPPIAVVHDVIVEHVKKYLASIGR